MAEENILKLLFSPMKLDRDKGVVELQIYLSTLKIDKAVSLYETLASLLGNLTSPWETKHGVLLGLKILIPALARFSDFNSVRNELQFRDKTGELVRLCLVFLTDEEVRVRLVAGEILGSLCSVHGLSVYELSHRRVLQLITENLEQERDSESQCPGSVSLENQDEVRINTHNEGALFTRRGSIDKNQLLQDTSGWKRLETSMKCLQFMVDGCGSTFQPYITHDLLDLLFSALPHSNRFVRETGFYVLGSLVNCGANNSDKSEDLNPFSAAQFGHQVSKQLANGLADNWSQVRLAASEATRKFLLSFSSTPEQAVFFPQLLPRMCLNRYYVADGVRIYSQETWRRVAKTEGRELVQKYIEHVVSYYVSQTSAENYAIREAACACIAELATKIEQEAVKTHVVLLLETLINCFQDDSWPVRDAACLACGNFVLCYPNEARHLLPKLYPLFFNNLKDCISSVRQGAAGALANVVRAYGLEAFAVTEAQMRLGLSGVENQPSESQAYFEDMPGLYDYSLVRRYRDNLDFHNDQSMYSQRFMGPRSTLGAGPGYYSEMSYRRPSEPWEFADGCVHLLAELSQQGEVSRLLIPLLPLLAEAVKHRHYAHHVSLLESLCKQLTNIAKGVGKKEFKCHLELFLDPIFYSLCCESALTSSAASQCLNQLSTFIGPNILRARVENHNASFLNQLDANTHIAAY